MLLLLAVLSCAILSSGGVAGRRSRPGEAARHQRGVRQGAGHRSADAHGRPGRAADPARASRRQHGRHPVRAGHRSGRRHRARTLRPLRQARRAPRPSTRGVTVNNRVRGQLEAAFSGVPAVLRLARRAPGCGQEARILGSGFGWADPGKGPRHGDRSRHQDGACADQGRRIDLKSSDPQAAHGAVRRCWARAIVQRTKQLLYALLEQDANGAYTEPDAKVREAARAPRSRRSTSAWR